jgi:hypothetical protein
MHLSEFGLHLRRDSNSLSASFHLELSLKYSSFQPIPFADLTIYIPLGHHMRGTALNRCHHFLKTNFHKQIFYELRSSPGKQARVSSKTCKYRVHHNTVQKLKQDGRHCVTHRATRARCDHGRVPRLPVVALEGALARHQTPSPNLQEPQQHATQTIILDRRAL